MRSTKTRSLTAILTILLAGLIAALAIWIEGDKALPAGHGPLTLWPDEEQLLPPDPLPPPPVPRASADAPGGARAVAGAAVGVDDEGVPVDALWVEGRVVFRAATPHDEALWVLARGDAPWPAEGGQLATYWTRVAQDGRFRVAFAPGSRRGLLGVDARYHFLEAPVEVDLAAPPALLALEPRLGGAVRGRVSVPPDLPAPPEGFGAVVVRADGGTPGGARVLRSVAVDPDGRFELRALPPQDRYALRVEAERFVDEQGLSVAVRPGECAELEVPLRVGVAVHGTLFDADGAPLAGAPVRVDALVRRGTGRRSSSNFVSTDARGAFVALGVEPGELSLSVDVDGAPRLERALGEWPGGGVCGPLEVRLEAGLELAGRVEWPDGRPAAGASVRVLQAGDDPWNAGPDRAAAADGGFVFRGLDARACTVLAWATRADANGVERRHVAVLDGVAAGTRGLELSLSPGAQLAGRAVDDRGRPLARFEVRATPFGAGAAGRLAQEQRIEDAGGAFLLTGLVAGEWTLAARAEGHADAGPLPFTVPDEGGPLELVLARHAALSGVVRDAAGAPAAGARVVLEPTAGVTVITPGAAAANARTADAGGAFRFEAVDPGTVRLRASLEGQADSEALELELAPGGAVEGLELTLRRPARIAGEVHASQGEVAGRVVELRPLGGGRSRSLATGVAGQFAFESLAPGEYVLSLQAPSDPAASDESWLLRDARRAQARVDVAPGEARFVVLGAPEGRTILVRGRVLDGGRAVPNATVTCRTAGGPRTSGARTDADGRFALNLDRPGDYTAAIGSEWGALVELPFSVPRARAVDVELELPAGSLAGTVRGTTGAPLAGVPLALLPRDAPGAGARQATTDSEGRFAFRHLPPGRYDLQAGGAEPWSAAGPAAAHGRTLVPDLVLADGEERAGFDLELGASGAITGVVLGPDGAPLADAWIEVEDLGGRRLFTWSATRSDAEGRFRQPGVGAGRFRVRARFEGRASAPREVAVRGGVESELTLFVADRR